MTLPLSLHKTLDMIFHRSEVKQFPIQTLKQTSLHFQVLGRKKFQGASFITHIVNKQTTTTKALLCLPQYFTWNSQQGCLKTFSFSLQLFMHCKGLFINQKSHPTVCHHFQERNRTITVFLVLYLTSEEELTNTSEI